MDYIILAVALAAFIVSVITLTAVLRVKKNSAGGEQGDYAREISKQIDRGNAELGGAVSAVNRNINQSLTDNFKLLTENMGALTKAEMETGKQNNEYVRLFLDAMKADIDKRLSEMTANNAKKLDEMKRAVDEKLAESLEGRVKLAFDGVNSRLTEIQKGFAEVERLSGEVTKLNGVFTNVKNRGTWGEIALENILGDILAPSLYERQCRIAGREAVDFAVKMPGSGEGIYLPIDAKFPVANYDRLAEAYDSGDKEVAVFARKRLLSALREQAKSISEKYIVPPKTTNFAIMYLPTEGLFAEAVRDAGFIDELRTKFRIIPCGPTTVAALLNSLTVGFTTLKIQKKSAEVVLLIRDFIKDFEKFTDLIDKIRKNSETIASTIESMDKRNEIIKKKLGSFNITELGEGDGALLQDDALKVAENN